MTVPLTPTVFETLTVPLTAVVRLETLTVPEATIVCEAASHTRPPVTPLACVVVVGMEAPPPPETVTVPEIETVPLTAAETVWLAAR